MNDLSNMVRDDLGRFLKNLSDTKPELRAAETARIMLVRRTRSGYDRHGRPFARYRPRTIQIKQRVGQQTSPVNLTDSGRMLDGLQAQSAPGHQAFTVQGGSTRRASRIVHTDPRYDRIIRFHIAGTRRMPQRDFAGLTEREQRGIERQFRADVERAVPEDRRRRVQIKLFS